MDNLVTKPRFLKYQQKFYSKVSKSDIIATIKVHTATPDSGSLADFVGDSPRDTDDYQLPVLFNKDPEQMEREETGITDTLTATVYFSPIQLIEILGTFRLDVKKVTIVLQEQEYVINSRQYLELMYDSCVAVEYGLISLIKE